MVRLKPDATFGFRTGMVRLKPDATIGLAVLVYAVVVVLSGAPKADTPAPAALDILPHAVVLRGQGSRQQLLVEARAGTTYTGNRTGTSTFASSNPNVATVDAAGVVAAVGDGRTHHHRARRGGVGVDGRRGRAGVRAVSADVPQPRHPGAHAGRVQLGPVPRLAVGQERIQADAARIRSRGRLPDVDAPGRGAPHQQGRARTKPHAAEADARRLARRRQAVRAPLAGVRRDRAVDRRRHAGAGRLGSVDDAPRGVSARGAAEARRRAADRRPRALLRRSRRRRDALGQVLLERRGGRDGERRGRREGAGRRARRPSPPGI